MQTRNHGPRAGSFMPVRPHRALTFFFSVVALAACSDPSESNPEGETDDPATAGETDDPGTDSESGPCGPCASPTETGVTELDDMFLEANALESGIDSTRANLDAHVVALAESWGLSYADVEVDAEVISQLMSDIAASINAGTSAPVVLDIVTPSCSETTLGVFDCTGASVEISYEVAPGLGDAFEGDFNESMTDLETRSTAMLADAALLRAIVEGELDGDGVPDIDPPLAATTASLQGTVEQGASGELFENMTDCETGCVFTALADQISELVNASAEATALQGAHAQFAGGLVALEG